MLRNKWQIQPFIPLYTFLIFEVKSQKWHLRPNFNLEIHIHILDSIVKKGGIYNNLEEIGIVFEPSKWVEAEICFMNHQH